MITRTSRIIKNLQLREDVQFKKFTRMSKSNFYTFLGMVDSVITKQNNRLIELVLGSMTSVIALGYLATVDSFNYVIVFTASFMRLML